MVVATVAGGENAQPDEVTGAQPRPAVQLSPPLGGNRGRAPAGAEQRTGDGRGGVGVVAGPDAQFECLLQVSGVGGVGVGDRPPRGLQRVHDPAVLRKVLRGAGFGLLDERRPVRHGALVGRVQEAVDAVEGAVQDRVADRERPQLACLGGALVVVGQRADRSRGLQTALGVVQVGDADRRGAHQRPVAALPAGER